MRRLRRSQQPGGIVILLARRWHKHHTIADNASRVEQSARDNTNINQPAGDFVGFEESQIQEKK